MAVANLFVSAVSAEFADYREALRRDLTRADVSVAVQEDFVASGSETLDKLDDYLRACDGVVHIVGAMTGAPAMAPSVALMRGRYPDLATRYPVLSPYLTAGGPALPYTQWEAWLALYHRRRLLVCAPEPGAPRAVRYRPDEAQREAQQAHLQRLASVERHVEFRFADAARLAIEVLRSPLGDLVRGSRAAPRNLPLRPNAFFTGRDALMQALARGLGPPPSDARSSARWCVLSGMGGVGKSRLALEFAWAQAAACSAALFVDASDGDALDRGLAALAAPRTLGLPEHDAPQQELRVAAVLRWLAEHPGWLLIADNVDSEAAASALESRLTPLAGGQLLVTSRLGRERWGGSVAPLDVDELDPGDAAAFLLRRTEGLRRPAGNDAEIAASVASELGHLALALEQAAAYVAQRKLTWQTYLQQWQQSRDTLLGWFDARVMAYPRSVAVTWQTSVRQLSPPALRLLQRLAWLASEPVPESLLEARCRDGDLLAADPWGALAELASLSLARRDDAQPRFTVHRLVQQVTRTGMAQAERRELLAEALTWLNAAFVGEPLDVRSWPTLDPLLPHALTVARRADAEGIAETPTWLLNQAGLLLRAKALHAPAELLMRRALAIDEAIFGPEHPNVAKLLGNLATVLQDTNRLVEAEPLMRRALAIDEASFGPQHPEVATDLNNLAQQLQAINRLAEAEPLMRRALTIDEASLGPDHPSVARDLNNLARLLQDTHRLAEAEPLMRRAFLVMARASEPEHPNTQTVLANYRNLVAAQGGDADAAVEQLVAEIARG